MAIVSHTARPASGHWRSFAKVNLCLRIVGRRADGYHLLDSIFLPIDLCDEISVTIREVRAGTATDVTMQVDDAAIPTDETNLAARAVRLLFDECGLGGSVSMELRKRIPPGAGLGGGSSNAATVLRGMNALLTLGVNSRRLHELGMRLGADVPFFLDPRPARVRGVGERIEPLAHWPPTSLVVVIPPIQVSTPWVFDRYREAVPVPQDHGPSEAAGLAAGARPTAAYLVNDLERIVLPAFPEIAAIKAGLVAAGAGAAVMSGSGAAVVGLASSPTAAGTIAAAIRTEVPAATVHVASIAPVG